MLFSLLGATQGRVSGLVILLTCLFIDVLQGFAYLCLHPKFHPKFHPHPGLEGAVAGAEKKTTVGPLHSSTHLGFLHRPFGASQGLFLSLRITAEYCGVQRTLSGLQKDYLGPRNDAKCFFSFFEIENKFFFSPKLWRPKKNYWLSPPVYGPALN